MNNSKLSFIALAMSAAICSCSDDNQNASSEYINSVRVTVEDFVPEILDTRTAYTVDNTGFHFTWTDGDALGIYPVGGDQVKFPISSGDGSASASFDGGAWKLRSTYQYAAYYPFSTANYTVAQTALPASFTGQTQDGNNSTAHLSTYDYLACAATAPDGNGGVDLAMKHLGAFLRLQLTMPKVDTYSSVVLESDGTEFVTSGTFDLTAATPAITSTATSSTFTINLNNISTTAANEEITIYAILAPSDLSTSNITITVHGIGLTTYVQTVTGKNFEARKAYNIAVTSFPSGTNASGEDVNWEEETATTGTTDGYDWVDLGLPSGTKWATCNVGATNPEDYGYYFAWGETTGHTADTSDGRLFNWANYKWMKTNYTDWEWINKYTLDDNQTGGAWYNNGTFIGDGKSTLDSSDDAASSNWGSNWHVPTKVEFKELLTSCYWRLTDNYNGKAGYIVFKAKDDKDKGKAAPSYTPSQTYTPSDLHIFFPFCGFRNEVNGTDRMVSKGTYGFYWYSELKTTYQAYHLMINSDLAGEAYVVRCIGASIRSVTK